MFGPAVLVLAPFSHFVWIQGWPSLQHLRIRTNLFCAAWLKSERPFFASCPFSSVEVILRYQSPSLRPFGAKRGLASILSTIKLCEDDIWRAIENLSACAGRRRPDCKFLCHCKTLKEHTCRPCRQMPRRWVIRCRGKRTWRIWSWSRHGSSCKTQIKWSLGFAWVKSAFSGIREDGQTENEELDKFDEACWVRGLNSKLRWLSFTLRDLDYLLTQFWRYFKKCLQTSFRTLRCSFSGRRHLTSFPCRTWTHRSCGSFVESSVQSRQICGEFWKWRLAAMCFVSKVFSWNMLCFLFLTWIFTWTYLFPLKLGFLRIGRTEESTAWKESGPSGSFGAWVV